jgi:hypothetical protein
MKNRYQNTRRTKFFRSLLESKIVAGSFSQFVQLYLRDAKELYPV